ncbi:hypothetical protein TPHA_0P00340 [Tetrapisispora phaffii CBS 4417]|uniref:Structural maintenance of chromosomes protein n=1 Tax=Tetrapisispora phaffii (strain ATCC 24235 / CBS 4417 / NBRC 1672 / NRRL Y-8282 / UCD 70-5) TaxID=1071381 RepID=G8C214_TETPH|nr:hypothetical protein TPHA_0P00340 [Tetrapisispora phaffii CBS 4417]CCE66192.1 hypothetical protein TPHA_0P00340 [Tetrapisispora phaffii CBS 4417]
MGRLVGLELFNFKSYKGVTKVGFGESNFTSIIGPNGSGKSNMMDAISFVLGFQSSNLRSSTLKDLVYRDIASADENEFGEDGERSAYVKAFYEKDGTVVELMRAITAGRDSVYKIDNKTTTYKHYSDFLAAENILIKARNFLVFQGDVEQIAAQSPRQLTKLFEEVSGSIKYKKEYEELKEKIEKLSESAAESAKNRRRIQGEMKIYEDGISKDEKYKKQLEVRDKLQVHLALWQLFHLEQEEKLSTKKLKEVKNKVMKLTDQVNEEETNVKKAKNEVIKETSLQMKQQNRLDYKEKEKDNLLSELTPIQLSQRSAEKRLANIEKRIESIARDMERQKTYVSRYEKQLKVVKKTKDTFEEELKQSNSNPDKYRLNDEDMKLYERLNEQYLTEGGFELDTKLSLLNNEKKDIDDELELLQKRIDMSKNRITDEFAVKGENFELQAVELSSELNEKNSLHLNLANKLKKIQSDIESTSNKEYELNHKLRDTLVKLDDASANQRETLKEKKLRENVSMLKRFFPGVKGLVSDLCHPKKEKYALAVSTILGKNFDSVVVDTLSVAQECITYLKKQRAGIISFIPLDTIDAFVPTLPTTNIQGITLVLNAIDYDQEYDKAMQYVCSDSIMCDTLSIAKSLKWKHNVTSKLVTLEGTLIHRAGLMTGGVSKEQGNRWDKEEYQGLVTLKDKLLIQIEQLSNNSKTFAIEARDLESNISQLNSSISDLRTQISQINRSIEENKAEVQYHEDMLKKEYEPKQNQLNTKLESIEKSKSEIIGQKELLQNTVFKEFHNKLGFTIQEYEHHSGEALRQSNKELQQLEKQVLNIESKLQFEVERYESTEKRHKKAQIDLENNNSTIESLQENEAEVVAKIKDIENGMLEIKKVLEDFSKEIDRKKKKLAIAEDSLSEKSELLTTSTNEKISIKEEIEKKDLEKLGILTNCKISNIQVPVASKIDLNNLPIGKIDNDAILISNEISLDYKTLPAKYKESSSSKIRSALEHEIEVVEDLLQDLQPNARAVDRFDEAKERFDSASDETETLKKQERKLLTQFLAIKKKRREVFEKAFDYVSEHIEPIYRELTKNPNSTAELSGGNASLTLEDEDEPFDAGIKYHATPPLKRFKDMEYLSGGEKTVAALALLFAINSYQPSPFFILDEVDAALDVTNIERIANYIRKHSNSDIQFIVISLKNSMFEKSDALVGIHRQQQENSSRVVTLDLSQYAD